MPAPARVSAMGDARLAIAERCGHATGSRPMYYSVRIR